MNHRRHCPHPRKKTRPTDREYNTGLYLLRCSELGLSDDDMEMLTYGMVLDMLTERANDQCEYNQLPTQDDFNAF